MGKTRKGSTPHGLIVRAVVAAATLSLQSAIAIAVALGPMFQKEFGSLQTNLNVLFERELGAGAEPGAEVAYQWQLKWGGDPRFEPGVQGFGTLGRTSDFGHQTEGSIGPAFFGQVATGARSKLKYDAAVLFGLNRNTPDTTLRFQLEYEMY